jgi:hypothetical protein
MAYETTTVSVEKSQGEIRRLLSDHGATRFAFGEETDAAGVRWAAVSFTFAGYAVRLRVPHKPINEARARTKAAAARTRTYEDIAAPMYEQEAKRIWRVMAWNLKARLVAVDEGVETFEEAFLAHLLDERTGRTIYEQLADDGRVELARPLLALNPGERS